MIRLVVAHESGPDRVLVTPKRSSGKSFMLTRDERVKAPCREIEIRVGATVLRVSIEDVEPGFAS